MRIGLFWYDFLWELLRKAGGDTFHASKSFHYLNFSSGSNPGLAQIFWICRYLGFIKCIPKLFSWMSLRTHRVSFFQNGFVVPFGTARLVYFGCHSKLSELTNCHKRRPSGPNPNYTVVFTMENPIFRIDHWGFYVKKPYIMNYDSIWEISKK